MALEGEDLVRVVPPREKTRKAAGQGKLLIGVLYTLFFHKLKDHSHTLQKGRLWPL